MTESIQEKLNRKQSLFDLEVVIWTDIFIAKKNRYAGRKVWDDKEGFKVLDYDINTDHWARIKMSGMEAKQTNTAPVGRDAA